MNEAKWLVISYNLPTEPSRHRVAAWRALKKLGAVNIQQSMWVLPYSQENLIFLNKVSEDIEKSSGETLLMESVFLSPSHENRIITTFNSIRNDEYAELISECRKYLKELEKEISINKFTYAELEEEEQELEKLISWHEKIRLRDVFKASSKTTAEDLLQQIKSAFENYSSLVYEKEGMQL